MKRRWRWGEWMLFLTPLPLLAVYLFRGGAQRTVGPAEFRHDAPVTALAFSPDSKMLATGSRSGQARLWEVKTGAIRKQIRTPYQRVRGLAFSPDGKMLAVVSGSGGMENLFGMRLDGGISWSAPSYRAAWMGRQLVFSSDGRHLTHFDGTIRLRDAATGKPWGRLKVPVSSEGYCVLSRDGTRLANLLNNDAVQIWDTHTGRLTRTMKFLPPGASRMSVATQGQALAAVIFRNIGGRNDYRVEVYDIFSGQLLHSENFGTTHISEIMLSPSGRTLAVRSGNNLRSLTFIAVPRRTVLHRTVPRQTVTRGPMPSGKGPSGEASPVKASTQASAGTASTGAAFTTVEIKDIMIAMTISPDDKTFAYSTFDGAVKLVPMAQDSNDSGNEGRNP